MQADAGENAPASAAKENVSATSIWSLDVILQQRGRSDDGGEIHLSSLDVIDNEQACRMLEALRESKPLDSLSLTS